MAKPTAPTVLDRGIARNSRLTTARATGDVTSIDEVAMDVLLLMYIEQVYAPGERDERVGKYDELHPRLMPEALKRPDLRRQAFAIYLSQHEAELTALYERLKLIAPAAEKGLLREFEWIMDTWARDRFQWTDIVPTPNTRTFRGPSRQALEKAAAQQRFDRAMRTAGNIRKSVAGAIGYHFGGDVGSDLGALAGQLLSLSARTLLDRARHQELNRGTPDQRPVAAQVAPRNPTRGTDRPGTGPLGPVRPPAPVPTQPPPVPPVPPAVPPLGPGSGAGQPPSGGSGSGGLPPAGPPGNKFTQRAAQLVQHYQGRLIDPQGELAITFRRTGATNALRSRAAVSELATIDAYLRPGYRGVGGRAVHSVIVLRPARGTRTPDLIVRHSDGHAHSVEITTVTSAPLPRAAANKTHADRVAETKQRPPLQVNIENRLIDKGVAVPGGKPLQLSVFRPEAGRAGGELRVFVQQPDARAEAMCRGALQQVQARLSPFVETVTFVVWTRSTPSAALRRHDISFDRQPDGTYVQRR